MRIQDYSKRYDNYTSEGDECNARVALLTETKDMNLQFPHCNLFFSAKGSKTFIFIPID